MVTAGLLAIMAAALFPLLHMATQWGRYLYAAGSLILLAGRFVAPKVKDAPLRLRRLIRVEVWTALISLPGQSSCSYRQPERQIGWPSLSPADC